MADLGHHARIQGVVLRQHLLVGNVGVAQPDVTVGCKDPQVAERHRHVVGRCDAELQARLALQDQAGVIRATRRRRGEAGVHRMLPVAADIDAEVLDRQPHSLDIHAVRGSPVYPGEVLSGGRELLVRYTVEFAAEDVDDSVESRGLRAIADLVVPDGLGLRGAAAQVVEAGEVHATVDTPEHCHVLGELVVRAQGPGAARVVVLGALLGT